LLVRKLIKKESSILDQTTQIAFDKCIPLFATIETTLGCNYSCVHCYNFDRSSSMPDNIKGKPLKKEEFIRVIDELCEAGAFYISFTGGEALLYPHIYSLIERVVQNKSMPRVKTNGHLLTQEVCEKLDKAGCRALDISIYGADELSYKNFTGMADGYTKVLEGVKRALSFDMEINFNIILHKDNCMDIGKLIKLAESLGVPYQFSDEVTARYDGTESSQNFGITPDQYNELLKGPHKDLFWHDNSEESFQCSCARNVVGIGLDGVVYPCIGAPIPSGDLKKQSFKEIWDGSQEFKKIRDLKKEDFSDCVVCEFKHQCNRSSGSAFVNTENYTGCDPMALRVAQVRHKNKDSF
jgi:radical SAM protein with 4Fe4S-binding SPASM domain